MLTVNHLINDGFTMVLPTERFSKMRKIIGPKTTPGAKGTRDNTARTGSEAQPSTTT